MSRRCPGADEIQQYEAQELPEERAAAVRAHLEACPACANRHAAHLQKEQQLVDELREIGLAGIADLDMSATDVAAAAAGGPAPPVASPAEGAAAESIGPAIEGYRIVEELHRGGQGIVYRAMQEHTRREVAIKVLLEGPDASPAARRRFEREIELAAQLKHPHIVAIFHSGLTPGGRQYCVMDYVPGRPLDQYVRAEQLPLERTLELFASACDAVAYAHQRGIIHRDLKPSNIIVDAAGSPRVLDFGLAKQMFGPAETFASVSGQVFGTLPYMSPEQTSGRPEEIDTRSDIYALGVILYQLLTGRFPYPVEDPLIEVIRHITQTPPIPPSQSWTSAAGVRKRSAQPREGSACPIDDEVQTIVLKALAKEPERRYQSVLELADDLRRYLVGDPIAAKRTSHWYVLQKLVRRYRVRFAVAAAMVVLAVGSTVALSIMYRRQARLLNTVREERTRAVAAEDRAQRRFNQVRELAHTFIFDFHGLIEHLKGATAARELLVKTALRYLDGLAAEADDDPSLQRELAIAYQKVADVQGAPGAPNLGDSGGALAGYQKAVQIFESRVEADPDRVEARRELADCYDKLGTLQAQLNQTTAAMDCYSKALQCYQQLAERLPDQLDIQRGLARCYLRIGDIQRNTARTADALASYQQALAIRLAVANAMPEDATVQRELAITQGRLGAVAWTLGDRDAALSAHQQSLQISRALAAAEPDSAQAQRDLSEDLNDMGDAMRAMGQYEEALTHYEQGLRIRRELARVDPENVEAQRDLALSFNRVGGANRMMKRMPEALAAYQEGLRIAQSWAASRPDDVRPKMALRVFHTTIGYCQVAAGQAAAGLASYEQALAIARAVADMDPQSAKAQRDLAVGYYRVGRAQKALGAFDAALGSYTRCLEIRAKLVEADPDNVKFQRSLAEVRFELASVHATLGSDEALPRADRLAHWRQAQAWYEQAREIHLAMRQAGTLFTVDADMPEEIARRLANCDAAIATLQPAE